MYYRVISSSLMHALIFLLALSQDRPQVVIQNPNAEAIFDLGGGSFVSFKLKNGLNPLRWLGPADEKAINRPMAHFLCLDRWGQPSFSAVNALRRTPLPGGRYFWQAFRERPLHV